MFQMTSLPSVPVVETKPLPMFTRAVTAFSCFVQSLSVFPAPPEEDSPRETLDSNMLRAEAKPLSFRAPPAAAAFFLSRYWLNSQPPAAPPGQAKGSGSGRSVR